MSDYLLKQLENMSEMEKRHIKVSQINLDVQIT